MTPSNHRIENSKIYQRYCSDNYSTEDLKTIYKWFEEPGYGLVRNIVMKKYWMELRGKKKSSELIESDELLGRIHHKINLAEDGLSSPHKERNENTRMSLFLKMFSRVAAVLIIPLLTFSLYYFINDHRLFSTNEIVYTELYAPLGSRIKLDLPDGSEVWLNHGSKLKYPREFSNKTREVVLIGEGYFAVNEDHKKPFIITTSGISIQVLGTRFNLSAYPDDNFITTTLEDGKVRLNQALPDGSNRKLGDLEPGEQGIFQIDSKRLSIQSVNTTKYTAWKDGILLFLDDPMDVVVKKLELWYNVDIEIEDSELGELKYTATLVDETLPQVLKLMSLATPIEYTILPRIKQPDNTFSKGKVIIRSGN